MILIDFSQTIIAGLMAQLKANDGEMSEDLLRHMIINSLRNYQKRYAEEYGESTEEQGDRYRRINNQQDEAKEQEQR